MKYFLVTLIPLLLSSCTPDKTTKTDAKETILLANREAPLGWVYLRIHADSTFEFESKGLEKTGTIYSGAIQLKGDTILFRYQDSIPKAGDRAILTDRTVSYFGGKYPERVEIKLNKIKSN